jgi:hypothetical protein
VGHASDADLSEILVLQIPECHLRVWRIVLGGVELIDGVGAAGERVSGEVLDP